MTILKAYYDLKYQVEVLTELEEKNWQKYLDFITIHGISESKYKQRIFDYINQLGFLKREIEQKILDEYKKLESSDKLIGAF
jgi:hypothetical protein